MVLITEGKTSPRRNSLHSRVYTSTFLLSLDYKNNVHVLKDRFQSPNHQPLSEEETIKAVVRILVGQKFKDNLKMFKEGLQKELTISIQKIMKEGVNR